MIFAFLTVLALQPAAQEAKLELGSPRMTYGYLGAARPKSGVLPGDVAHFTFEIKNLKLNNMGKASYSIAIEIRDANGKLLFEQRPYNSVTRNFFGGTSLPCSASVEIPRDAKAGAVDWKVTVQDRTTKQTAELTGKGLILPADFGIVRVGLFADAETRVPMSAVGVVGDSAYLQLSAVGFERDKTKKQPNVSISLRILDENGKADDGRADHREDRRRRARRRPLSANDVRHHPQPPRPLHARTDGGGSPHRQNLAHLLRHPRVAAGVRLRRWLPTCTNRRLTRPGKLPANRPRKPSRCSNGLPPKSICDRVVTDTVRIAADGVEQVQAVDIGWAIISKPSAFRLTSSTSFRLLFHRRAARGGSGKT